MTQEIRLIDKLDQCYKTIYPALHKISQKFWSLGNPSILIDEWKSEAAFIAIKFDKGHIRKKVYLPENKDTDNAIVEFNPNIHSEQQLIASFNMYLKRAYANFLIKQLTIAHKDKVSASKLKYAAHTQTNASYKDSTASLDNAANISSIIKLIDSDILKLKDSKSNGIEASFNIFLSALKMASADIKESYGDFIAIGNIDCRENAGYLNKDYAGELELRIKKLIALAIIDENNPILVKQLSRMVMGERDFGLQKKVYRYFFEYRGGLRKRMHKFI